MEVIDWSIAHGVSMLTVYAFSTENWSRSRQEVDLLMSLFEFFFQKIRSAAREKGIFIRFVATEPQRLPPHILALMLEVERETREHPRRRIVVNVCVSYGGRGEVVSACRRLVDAAIPSSQITEEAFGRSLLRSVAEAESPKEDFLQHHDGLSAAEVATMAEPQLLLRTSGEQRISNFLLYQCAYSELVFLPQTWPEVTEADFVGVLADFAQRQRRFGK